MASLPSYEEAVSGGHWLDLAAPYMSIRCYAQLCRVSRRFHSQFSPRLWNDPLQAARHLGLHPNDDLKWLAYFITRHAKILQRSTRTLVTSLDFRAFAVDTPASVAGASGQSFTELLRQAGVLFPAARCILIGGKTSYDPVDLGRLLQPDAYPEDGSVPMPLVLDVSHCGLPLPNNFFHLSYWRQLVFLDMSYLPGSLQGLIKAGTFSPGAPAALPNLRVLKLRGRGLTEESLAPIAHFSQSRVWSLDLCQNKLTDASAHTLLPPCFGADDLTVDYCRSEVEGKLLDLDLHSGSALPPVWRGWLSYIQESPSSSAFSHPDRYLADAPVYDGIGRQSRLAGHERLQRDTAQDIKTPLAGGLGCPIPDWHDARDTAICKSPSSLTHLHLSGNPGFTAEGVEAVFRRSRGQIRHFDCASPAIPTMDHAQSKTFKIKQLKLAGILGRSHVFRPVFASNLQSLRIHHSLVTQIPTLLNVDLATRSPLSTLHYAETVLRERAELAYPLAFVPDLNPRLQSLTLTRLPRVSCGPLIDRLLQLLISASGQETAIRHTAAPLSRRSPAMVRGLRHIRLEFDPWPRRSDDHDATSALDSLDAGALLASGSDDFSFFKEPVASSSVSASAPAPASVSASPKQPTLRSFAAVTGQSNSSTDATSTLARIPSTPSGNLSVRLSHYPLPGAISAGSEYVWEKVSLDGDGERYSQTVAVWVGSGYSGYSGDRSSTRQSRALDAYMANLAEPSLRTNIRPATPDQVKAGVPMGVCVYNLAWDAIVWLESGPVTVATADYDPSSAKMKDVVDAIRQFRAKTKAEYAVGDRQTLAPTHCHWTGKLELMF